MDKKKDPNKSDDRKMDQRTVDKIKAYLKNLPLNKQLILDEMAMDLLSIANKTVSLGMKALYLKSGCKHGEFAELIEKTFIKSGACSYRTIRVSMQIARAILDNPKMADVCHFEDLGATQQLMLASASDEDWGEEDGEPTIFGLTIDDIKGRNVKQLKAEIESWKNKYQAQRSENVKGRDQLTEAREKLAELTDASRIVGASDKEAARILNKHLLSIMGVMELAIGDLVKDGPGSAAGLSKNVKAQVDGFLRSVSVLVEETIQKWAEATRKE